MSPTERPASAHHYDSAADMPAEIQKYWHQRYDLFSRYDEGIWLTDAAWFGVTPESIAGKIAEHVAAAANQGGVLIDAFAGAGGNAIAFALSGRWRQIFAVERDAEVLACAKHNAEIYGVSNKIWWIHGDIFQVLRKQLKSVAKNAVIFGSPPWGGPSYTDYEVFDLSTMQPYSLETLYGAFSSVTNDMALYLPRTSDLRQLAKHVKKGEQVDVIHYCGRGSSKAICVYYGNFSGPVEPV